jgi:hypothetical protein
MEKSESYPVIQINNWPEFVDCVSAHPYRTWAFRGQGDSRWPLSSSLYRYLCAYLPDKAEWERREEHILRAFMRKAHLLLERVPEADNTFEWLGLMQHHGAPTRLIDFTWSPYVAAFFALERAAEEAAVWALHPARMKNITSAPNLPFGSGSKAELWYGEPFILSRRLVAQQGTFIIASSLDEPIDELIKSLKGPEDILVKFVLPVAQTRAEGMRSLYRMNITQATLFPGLDGLARSMAYELEFQYWE